MLSAYALHDPETGYCQGMSDLLVPFLLLTHDDVTAFWCFEALMQRARRNFAVDESGVHAQLRQLSGVLERTDAVLHHRLRQLGSAECFFAYRMLVVALRRDLPLEQVGGSLGSECRGLALCTWGWVVVTLEGGGGWGVKPLGGGAQRDLPLEQVGRSGGQSTGAWLAGWWVGVGYKVWVCARCRVALFGSSLKASNPGCKGKPPATADSHNLVLAFAWLRVYLLA